jgi:hypothetical protein
MLMAAVAASLAGCRSAGRFLQEMLRERPPAPLDSMSVASDVRIDSLGYVVGSFVGEGTSRAVHLLSSDTGFIAAMIRRYRPSMETRGELWMISPRNDWSLWHPAGGVVPDREGR